MAMRTIKKIIIRWNHQSAMFFWDPFVALKLKFGKVKVPIVYPDCPWSNPVFCVQQVLIFARCFFLFVSWLDHIKYVKSRFSWLNIPSFLLGEQSQHFCHQNHRCLFKGDPIRWHRGWWPRSEGGVHHEMFVETMFDYHKQREHNTRAFSLETHIINTYQKPVGFWFMLMLTVLVAL